MRGQLHMVYTVFVVGKIFIPLITPPSPSPSPLFSQRKKNKKQKKGSEVLWFVSNCAPTLRLGRPLLPLRPLLLPLPLLILSSLLPCSVKLLWIISELLCHGVVVSDIIHPHRRSTANFAVRDSKVGDTSTQEVTRGPLSNSHLPYIDRA